jgi:hypothetical protein
MAEIIFNVDTFDKEAILKASKEGLSTKSYHNKMESTIIPNYLPCKGKFANAKLMEVKNPNPKGDPKGLNHWRIFTDTGDSISISALQALAHVGTPETAQFKQVVRPDSVLKGKYVVSSQAVNPQLIGKQVDIIGRLLGKEFTATALDNAWILSTTFDENGIPQGFSTIDECKEALTTKVLYKVTLVD